MSGFRSSLRAQLVGRGTAAEGSGGGVGAKPLHHRIFVRWSPSPSLRDRQEFQ